MSSPMDFRQFGILSTGEPVEAWTLTGRGGVVLECMTYGGIVTRLLAPDRNGDCGDVVLGFKELESYLAGHPYFGAITGRVAGRVAGARFELEGRTYQLAPNDPPNHLHGGPGGFDKRNWRATPVERSDGAPSLRLSYSSPAGEEGYPGNVDVAVTYTVTNGNEFLIESEAVSDCITPLSLTHHSYFNLAGEGSGSILDHRVEIFADEFIPADDRLISTGRLESVAGRGNDFRTPCRIGDAIGRLSQGHGDLYALPWDGGGAMYRAARVTDDASGRRMTVATTERYLQLYTGSHLEMTAKGKSGSGYGRYAGLCLECEGFPDVSNAAMRGDTLLQPGQPRRRATMYGFSIASGEGEDGTAAREGAGQR